MLSGLGNPWFAWNVGTVTTSTTENAVFAAKTQPWGAGGNQIYKCIVGNSASLQTPFVTIAAGKEFYGAAGIQCCQQRTGSDRYSIRLWRQLQIQQPLLL